MRKTNGILFALALAATTGSAKAADVIGYDNTASYQGQFSNRGNFEVGDQIRLSTGPSTLTSFQFEYNFTGVDGAATGTLRFWDLSGTTAGGGPAPGNLLFQSDVFNLNNGFNQAFVTNISLSVPESFVWTVDFNGVDGAEQAGLLFYNGATVGNGPGQSEDTSWENTSTDPGTVTWALVNTPSVFDNFGARVYVVPEPTTIALIATGGALVGLAARRRRKA